MKRILLAVLTAVTCISCSRELSLQEQILDAYNYPVRPGYEGKNPYWNKFAKKFMFAPAFDFKAVEGAVSYRYTVTQDIPEGAKSWTFEAEAPNLSLSPVWKDITVGDVILKVEALDNYGKVRDVAGERKFYRDSPFTPPYNSAVRDYKESAILALICLHNMP